MREISQALNYYIYFYNHQRIHSKTKLTPLELRSQFFV
ncbi:MAG: IS3 family transposase [Lachnospiraceae bacterium]